MYYTTSFLWALGTHLPLALSAPGLAPRGSVGRFQTIHDKTETTCSATTSTADVVPFAQNQYWVDAMTDCLGDLYTGTWAGTECAPKDDQGNPLGPTFGFWKGETHHSSAEDAYDCWTQCSGCLQEGINNHRAVTTSCQFKTYAWAGPAVIWTCNMGFDYGEMQVAANQTTRRVLRKARSEVGRKY